MTEPERPPLDAGVTMPAQDELATRDYLELAVSAEREGFHTFTVGEIAGTEAFTLLGALAGATSRIRLGTGVIAIYNRSPVLTAMGFASVASLAPGRVFAGLGTGSHRIVEDWNGRELRAPLRTMREFVAVLRTVLAGERVDGVDGEVRVREFRFQHPPAPGLPVFVGAFNPGMLRLAGAIADGVMLAIFPPEQLRELVAHVHEGAAAAGRDPASIEITASLHGYAGTRVEEALERFRRLFLEYAVRPTHRAAYVAAFPEIDRATELWHAGERRQALGLVPDEAVVSVYPIGSADELVRRLDAARTAGVTTPLLVPQAVARGDLASSLETLTAVGAALRARVAASRGAG